ncbi:LADA_0D07800g1_1 [Lachancea dasiensis]|uniref:LADA_0D07800g1_1 n=1 Tax=Lachancea dasiensis TaxID=1072105 RepID=A0A1G4J6U8_9SACH|nr:LADA_0D07800g1_1 [Lachancea dasiensis]
MPLVHILSDLCSISREINLEWDWKLLCEKLTQISGVLPADMLFEIELQDGTKKRVEKAVSRAGSLQQTLGQAPLIIRIIDTNENSIANELAQDPAFNSENTSGEAPSGFTLSEDDYQQRSDSVLQWKKNCGLGKFDPNYRAKLEKDLTFQADCATDLVLNERCLVSASDTTSERRGWLRYVGSLPGPRGAQGTWCGVEFDEPCGKNDGTLDGHVLFGPVKPQYGGFVKPSNVKTSSEYQPIDDFASDDEL